MSQQQKQRKPALAAIIAGAVVALALGLYFVPAQSSVNIEPTILPEDMETSQAIELALEYVRSSPTFAFDGIEDSLDLITVNMLESYPVQYRIEVAFDSTHGGFGNREDQMLTQAITPHVMELLVMEGQVISAITDGTWDEFNHQYVLKNPKLASDDTPVTSFEGVVNDYDSLISAIKSRGLVVEQVDTLADSSFAVPTMVLSVSGLDLQVYEFPTKEDTEIAKMMISEDGTEIGLSVIRWIDTPHFYSQGNIIVQYIGHNPEMLNLLDSLLGKQFAGM